MVILDHVNSVLNRLYTNELNINTEKGKSLIRRDANNSCWFTMSVVDE